MAGAPNAILLPASSIAVKAPDPALASAREHLKAGSLTAARNAVEKFLAENPKSAEALVLHGDILCAKKEYDNAIADYRKALEISLENGDAYIGLGKAFFGKGDYSESMNAFILGCKHSPSDKREALFMLADACIMDGKGENAKVALKKAGANPAFAMPQRYCVLMERGLNPPKLSGCA